MYRCGRTKNGDLFIVLELCDGTLTEFLFSASSVAPPSWTERLLFLSDVSLGMEYLHFEHNSIHRDLKCVFKLALFWPTPQATAGCPN